MLLLFVLLTTITSYAWSDDSGPWWKKWQGQGGNRRGVTEPFTIALVGIGLAGLGIYAIKKRKKD